MRLTSAGERRTVESPSAAVNLSATSQGAERLPRVIRRPEGGRRAGRRSGNGSGARRKPGNGPARQPRDTLRPPATIRDQRKQNLRQKERPLDNSPAPGRQTRPRSYARISVGSSAPALLTRYRGDRRRSTEHSPARGRRATVMWPHTKRCGCIVSTARAMPTVARPEPDGVRAFSADRYPISPCGPSALLARWRPSAILPSNPTASWRCPQQRIGLGHP